MSDRSRNMKEHAEEFLKKLEARHYSSETLKIRRFDLAVFLQWAEDRGMTDPEDISRPVIDRYQRYIFKYRKKNGEPLALSSQRGRLVAIKQFFKDLAQRYVILNNPTSELQMPREGHRLPRDPFNISEVELILIQPDIETPNGLRDRCLMELLYSTGVRRSELVGLSIYDIDFDRQVIMIREGKGRKDRVVPVGNRALLWLEKYLHEGRPLFCLQAEEPHLFFTKRGQYMSSSYLGSCVRRYIDQAGVNKKGSCHLFRHTVATLMLENGADIRYIQQLLGHAKLNTTEVYTRVSIDQLRKVHRLTHPADLNPQKSEPDSLN